MSLVKTFFEKGLFVAEAWSVQSLPSDPATRFDSRRGQGFLPLSWDWVCVLCVQSHVVFGVGLLILLTTDSSRSAIVY